MAAQWSLNGVARSTAWRTPLPSPAPPLQVPRRLPRLKTRTAGLRFHWRNRGLLTAGQCRGQGGPSPTSVGPSACHGAPGISRLQWSLWQHQRLRWPLRLAPEPTVPFGGRRIRPLRWSEHGALPKRSTLSFEAACCWGDFRPQPMISLQRRSHTGAPVPTGACRVDRWREQGLLRVWGPAAHVQDRKSVV